MSFRDRFFTPKVAHATTSPSAIVAAGAGAAAGMLIVPVAPPIGAIIGGVAAYVVRVLAAVPRAPARPGTDVRGLVDPWRSLMQGIIDARHRYDKAIASVRPGPLRDRLVEVGTKLDDAVDDASRIARAGNTLSEGRKQIDVPRIRLDLDFAQSNPQSERSSQTIRAIEAQLASADRLDRTIYDTYEQLQLLDARLDETVTRTVEIAVTQVDAQAMGGIGSEVESIVSEMEALRLAVEETDDTDLPDPTRPSAAPKGTTAPAAPAAPTDPAAPTSPAATSPPTAPTAEAFPTSPSASAAGRTDRSSTSIDPMDTAGTNDLGTDSGPDGRTDTGTTT